jgi:hypothetical protein
LQGWTKMSVHVVISAEEILPAQILSCQIYSNLSGLGCTTSLYQMQYSAFLAVAIHIDEVKD